MLKPASLEWRELPWDRALRAASPKVAEPLEKALAGQDLGLEEGLTLANVEGDDLLALVKVADEIRRRVAEITARDRGGSVLRSGRPHPHAFNVGQRFWHACPSRSES